MPNNTHCKLLQAVSYSHLSLMRPVAVSDNPMISSPEEIVSSLNECQTLVRIHVINLAYHASIISLAVYAVEYVLGLNMSVCIIALR